MTCEIAATGTSHGLAEAVLHAQRLLREAATTHGLVQAATQIASAAGSAGCNTLISASASARGAVAAAVLLSGGSLSEVGEDDVLGGQISRVLVVEVAAISGLAVRRRVNSLREAGASWIGLVVLHDVAPAGAISELESERFGLVDFLAAAG